MGRRPALLWWVALLILWLLACGFDRHWLSTDQRLPAWDQADYLNSAVDHGRALGLLPGDDRRGWAELLDLSPKIPPIASLVSGTTMAIVGDSPDAASWSLSLWHGVLLVVAALWGRRLLSPAFGLLVAVLMVVTPALAALRVDFTLEIPLTAGVCLAQWRLWCWQRPDPEGGRWGQAITAALAIALALLIKQSALLFLAPPAIWGWARSLAQPSRRLQGWLGLGVVVLLIAPWLHHNWISTLGGTERAVIRSGAQEGDPGSLDPRSLLWYPRLWPAQLGPLSTGIGLVGLLLKAWQGRGSPLALQGSGWAWLLGCMVSGWACVSLSPNKDPRYIVPLLPILVLLLARGWWQLIAWMRGRWPALVTGGLIGAGLLGTASGTVQERLSDRVPQRTGGIQEAMEALRRRVEQRPTTLLITASEPELNEHTLTLLGRQDGGRILVRRLGNSPGHAEIALEQGEWWLLATGNQGTRRRSARRLSRQVRVDGRYQRLKTWNWSRGRQLELWQRRDTAPDPRPLDRPFIGLARGMERGPQGLADVFASIGTWHLVDPHFAYQGHVNRWAHARLKTQPSDRDALWSLALLAVLENRPDAAESLFGRLEQLQGPGGWPSAYRSVVLLADWNGCGAARVADAGLSGRKHEADRVLTALRDLGRSGCLDPRGFLNLPRSLPPAIRGVSEQLNRRAEAAARPIPSTPTSLGMHRGNH